MFKKLLVLLSLFYAALSFAAVDVNTASAADLDSVKGIGPGMSKRIINERAKGQFKDWGDFIARVKGVGEKNAANFSAGGMTVNGAGYAGAPAKPAKDAKAKKEKTVAAIPAIATKPAAPAMPAAPAAPAKPAAPAVKQGVLALLGLASRPAHAAARRGTFTRAPFCFIFNSCLRLSGLRWRPFWPSTHVQTAPNPPPPGV